MRFSEFCELSGDTGAEGKKGRGPSLHRDVVNVSVKETNAGPSLACKFRRIFANFCDWWKEKFPVFGFQLGRNSETSGQFVRKIGSVGVREDFRQCIVEACARFYL